MRNKISVIKSGCLLTIILLASCTSDKPPVPVDCNLNPVKITSFSTKMARCGFEDGSLTIIASGGSGEYQYSIDGENFQIANTFNNLQSGNYIVTVEDKGGCTTSLTAIIENDANMTIDALSTSDSGCGTESGIISVDVSGGQPPYQYRIENGNYQDDSSISGLPAGTVTVFARDSNGCEISAMVELTTGTSLENEVMPILETNCAISGCHDGNGSLIDWSDQSNVIDNAKNIKTRTGNKTMPPGGRTITDEEIQTIACWVDDGALDN